MSAAFTVSLDLVLQEIKAIHALRRFARTKHLLFAIDLCLVAHGIRSGYLVDTLCPPDPIQTFTALLKALRDKDKIHSAFVHVACWHHAPTMQSFFVHVPLLRDKMTIVEKCVFVRLDKLLSVSRASPDTLGEALYDGMSSIAESSDVLSYSLSDTLTEETLIPLAAVLIDYPIAYVPARSGQTLFLEREPLDIYTVSFKGLMTSDPIFELEDGHTLLRFSCPQVLIHDHPELCPGTMIEQLRLKFTPRLERIGMRFIVTHRTETLDRVAL